MNILVVGAGATGGYFGARLAQRGRNVTFLVRPKRASVLRERGLRVIGLGVTETIRPELVMAAQISAPHDVVLLSVKATALPRAMDDLAPAVGPETVIIPFLNGMAHLDRLNVRFGPASVLGGVVKVATTVNEDGDIVRLASFASLAIGEQNGDRSQRLHALQPVLGEAGFDFTVSSDIIAAMWHKWVFIATVGAATCLMRGTVGDIVAVDGGADFGCHLLAEAAAVAAAAGHPLPPAELAATTRTITESGSSTASSLYRDLVDGYPTEAEHILGDLVSRARRLSVRTPLFDLATMHLRVFDRRVTSQPRAAPG
jgi:2-dehydropantoate 2-reductase